jgi:hypothetical protein
VIGGGGGGGKGQRNYKSFDSNNYIIVRMIFDT